MADDKKELKVSPGLHTVRELFDLADFDFEKHATVDYGAGEFIDHRVVRVGGLPFDSVDKVIDIPEDADRVEIEVEGEMKKALTVQKDAGVRSVRELSDTAQLPS
jgi:hypothetical protein